MRRALLLCLALFVLVYVVPLGVRPIVIPDETRYGGVPREMLSGGDWSVPHLDGLRYFEKPIFGYWANAGSMLLFGQNAFAIRFPSALAAGLTALMVLLLCSRYLGGIRSGLLAAGVLLTCGEFFAVGIFSVLDGLFSAHVAVVVGLKKGSRLGEPLLRFAFCWLVLPFLFLSASGGKLGTYILPCYAPLAILCSVGLTRLLVTGRERSFNLGAAMLGTVWVLAASSVLIRPVVDLFDLSEMFGGELWKLWVGAATLLLWSGCLFAAATSRSAQTKLVLFCAAPVAFYFTAHFLTPRSEIERECPEAFLRTQADRISPETLLVSDERLIRAVCWFYRRDDVYILDRMGELKYGLGYADSEDRALTVEEFERLTTAPREDRSRVVLIASKKRHASWQQSLPAPTHLVEEGRFVLAEYSLRQEAPGSLVPLNRDPRSARTP